MANDNDEIKKINFADFMSPKGSDDMETFFDSLLYSGVPVSITAEEFCSDKSAVFNAEFLSQNLDFHSKWLIAKVAAFEALNDIGFEAIKAKSDRCEVTEVKYMYCSVTFKGEWCRMDGVVYASYGGVIEVASASEARTKRERDIADLKTAHYLLLGLSNHSESFPVAA